MTDYGVLLDMDSSVDISDKVGCYKHGKTWECVCGAPMWGYYRTKQKKCYECGKLNVDPKSEEREPPKTDDGQMTLGSFS